MRNFQHLFNKQLKIRIMIDYAELVQNVISGEESPLKAYAIMALLKKDLDKSLKEIKEVAIEEAARHGAKTFEDHGFKFELRAGKTTYSYKHIEAWKNTKEELVSIEAKAKQALASSKNGLQVASEDGEEVELPEVTYAADSLIVK